jgi:hypothetical protein
MKIELEIPKEYERIAKRLLKDIRAESVIKSGLEVELERRIKIENLAKGAKSVVTKLKLSKDEIKELVENTRSKWAKKLGLIE